MGDVYMFCITELQLWAARLSEHHAHAGSSRVRSAASGGVEQRDWMCWV